MIVCSCHCITDKDIQRQVGPDGRGCSAAGTSCGNCLPLVTEIVAQIQAANGGKTTSRPDAAAHTSRR